MKQLIKFGNWEIRYVNDFDKQDNNNEKEYMRKYYNLERPILYDIQERDMQELLDFLIYEKGLKRQYKRLLNSKHTISQVEVENEN